MTFPELSPLHFRDRYPVVAQSGAAGVSTMEVYYNGELVEVESGTYTLRDPSGSTVAGTGITFPSGVPTATYPAITDLGEGYREEWSLDTDLASPTKFREFVVARSPLACPVSEVDLLTSYPELRRNLGTTITSFQSYIDDAWARVLQKLRQGGELPYLIVSQSALALPVIELTLHLIYRSWFSASNGERWQVLYQEHWAAYEREWGQVSYTADRDQDGVADNQSRKARGAIVNPNASPASINGNFRGYRRVW